ncbi:MAG: DUF229 domain-containing protein [Planctomycetota bacterium]|nr:MAG: DUF229 domain-containing protein [Planctomycetota bacterium]
MNKLGIPLLWLAACLGLGACGGDGAADPSGNSTPAENSTVGDQPGPAAKGSGEKALNLILLVMDTCRRDRVGAYRQEQSLTPNLDLLAEDAVVFEDCLSQASATLPSHRSLFTGHYVHRHGNITNAESMRSPYTLAEILQKAGWKTVGFNGGGSLNPSFGLNQGFDIYQCGSGPKGGKKGVFSVFQDRLKPFFEQAGDQPFFLFLHGYDPHCPYWPPQPWRDKHGSWYQGKLALDDLCGRGDFQPLFDQDRLTEEDIRFVQSMYDGGVESADQSLGWVLDQLRQNDLLENSIVVFASDHGESLGEHRWIGHIRMWEEQLQIPLMIRFPGGAWSQRVAEPAELLDLFPTLLTALGLPTPKGNQGFDWMPMIRGEAPPPAAERMRLAKFAGWEAVRFDREWKLVFRHSGGKLAQKHLWNLLQDPEETVDHYQTEEGREIFERLYQRYRDWRRETSDQDRRFASTLFRKRIDQSAQRTLDELGYGGEEDEE